jgi:hypothetical protein
MGNLPGGGTRVQALCGNDSKIALRKLARIRSGVELYRKLGSAADAQTAMVYGTNLFLRYIVGVNLDIWTPAEMSSEHATQCATTNDANLGDHFSSVTESRPGYGLKPQTIPLPGEDFNPMASILVALAIR